MRDFHLRFCLEDMERLFGESQYARLFGRSRNGGWFDTNNNNGYNTFNLLEDEVSDIPDKSGAYVLGTRDGTMLTYPWGVSPIYYIGKASSIRNRLSEHKKFTLEAKNDHKKESLVSRDQYGAAFGADCVWYIAYDDMDPQNLEAKLVTRFYRVYGAIPVANHKWPKPPETKQGWPG